MHSVQVCYAVVTLTTDHCTVAIFPESSLLERRRLVARRS